MSCCCCGPPLWQTPQRASARCFRGPGGSGLLARVPALCAHRQLRGQAGEGAGLPTGSLLASPPCGVSRLLWALPRMERLLTLQSMVHTEPLPWAPSVWVSCASGFSGLRIGEGMRAGLSLSLPSRICHPSPRGGPLFGSARALTWSLRSRECLASVAGPHRALGASCYGCGPVWPEMRLLQHALPVLDSRWFPFLPSGEQSPLSPVGFCFAFTARHSSGIAPLALRLVLHSGPLALFKLVSLRSRW